MILLVPSYPSSYTSLAKSHNHSENVSNKLFCSNEYAQMGIWYDALYCAYTVESQNISDEMNEFWSLLKEIDLNFVAHSNQP